MSYLADRQLYGLDALGYHITNLLLHILNTLLLFLVLSRMTGLAWRSSFVAALFAIHPLHVESVAWIAERKDVLSTLFWMLSMWAYVRYAEHPGLKRYLPVVLFLALGLMSKPMLVTLPLMLLLLDYWPLGRYASLRSNEVGAAAAVWRLVWEKAPLFALAAASSVLTFFVQQTGGAVSSSEALPFGVRVANALVAYVSYIGKTIWPQGLAALYPHPRTTLPTWEVVLSGLLLIWVSAVAVRAARKHPYAAVGWLWYVVTLVPVIGLVQIGSHAMADRFTYVPLVGIFVMAAWGAPDLVGRLAKGAGLRQDAHRRASVAPLAVGVILALTVCTFIQVGYWRDGVALWTHAVEVTRNNASAHCSLGDALRKQGNIEEATIHLYQAVQIDPNDADARNNLASALFEQGRDGEAIAEYYEVLRFKPHNADVQTNLGTALLRQGRFDEALPHLTEALRISPEHPGAHNSLGVLLAQQGKLDQAIAHFSEAVRIDPGREDYRKNLASALALKKGSR
jgi:Flp pilus assembly protein TadD